jgi:hypothetical protein
MNYWYMPFLLLIWNLEAIFCYNEHSFPQYCFMYKLIFN